jgi:ATP synthase protein I
VQEQSEPRSQIAVGIQWANRITGIALEFVVPMILGVLLDRWWGTNPFATILGGILGFVMGLWHVMRLASSMPSPRSRSSSTPPPEDRA